MARIKDSSVDAVKAAAEILPLVEDHVRLRKAGGTYKGLCPFHQERTPSFTVTPARGTFKCFGCGEGGDAINFVQRLEGVDVHPALLVPPRARHLAVDQEGVERVGRPRVEDRAAVLLAQHRGAPGVSQQGRVPHR